jgi:uncharacterized membrane protein
MRLRTGVFLLIAGLGAVLGLIYSAYSTADFISHLDRELHPVSCSFTPGLAAPTMLDEEASGCKVAMFSPYSSFWRIHYWGGVPWSLLGLGLFGFAATLVLWGLITRRGHHAVACTWLLLAGLGAVGTSVVFFWLSLTRVGSFCTLCVGTYVSSAILLIGAILACLSARKDRVPEEAARAAADDSTLAPAPTSSILCTLLVGLALCAAVVTPAYVYVETMPDYDQYVTSCGALLAHDASEKLTLPLARRRGAAPSLLVVDPLCAACKAFHERLEETGYDARLSIDMLLMPMDTECNWMIKDDMHPGACLLSRALLCAGERVQEVQDFIYEHQEDFRLAGLGGKIERIREPLMARFPKLKTCVDARATKTRLNKVLRHAVTNALPLLTPQLYINGRRLCDEDTDLGLDYTMPRLLHARDVTGHGAGGER